MPDAAPALPDDVRASFLEVVPDAADDSEPQIIDAGPRRVDLGNDDWALLIDPDELRAGHRKRILASIPSEVTDIGRGLSMVDGVAMIAVTAWSLDLPIPADDPAFLEGRGFADSLDKLTFVQETALHDALADYQQILFRRKATSPTEPGTRPTGRSGG